ALDGLIEMYMSKERRPDEWDLKGFKEQLRLLFTFDTDQERMNLSELNPVDARDAIWEKLEAKYAEKEVQLGIEAMRNLERYIMLNIVDAQWKDHLLALDHLKEGI